MVVLIYKHRNVYSALLISSCHAYEKLVLVVACDIWGCSLYWEGNVIVLLGEGVLWQQLRLESVMQISA